MAPLKKLRVLRHLTAKRPGVLIADLGDDVLATARAAAGAPRPAGSTAALSAVLRAVSRATRTEGIPSDAWMYSAEAPAVFRFRARFLSSTGPQVTLPTGVTVVEIVCGHVFVALDDTKALAERKQGKTTPGNWMTNWTLAPVDIEGRSLTATSFKMQDLVSAIFAITKGKPVRIEWLKHCLC